MSSGDLGVGGQVRGEVKRASKCGVRGFGAWGEDILPENPS